MKDIDLKNTDPEDIEDLLLKVEKSFDIEFAENELAHITTFGEMCDHIKNKIQLQNSDDCTSQQAFYKVRKVLVSLCENDKTNITPETILADLLPRQKRKKRIKQMQRELGFELSLLRPRYFMSGFLILSLLISIVGLFFRTDIGLVGLGISIFGLWVSDKTGNELRLKTVGQLVEEMTRENYLKSRRNSKTYNKNEIEKILIDWFSNDLLIDKAKLVSEAKLT